MSIPAALSGVLPASSAVNPASTSNTSEAQSAASLSLAQILTARILDTLSSTSSQPAAAPSPSSAPATTTQAAGVPPLQSTSTLVQALEAPNATADAVGTGGTGGIKGHDHPIQIPPPSSNSQLTSGPDQGQASATQPAAAPSSSSASTTTMQAAGFQASATDQDALPTMASLESDIEALAQIIHAGASRMPYLKAHVEELETRWMAQEDEATRSRLARLQAEKQLLESETADEVKLAQLGAQKQALESWLDKEIQNRLQIENQERQWQLDFQRTHPNIARLQARNEQLKSQLLNNGTLLGIARGATPRLNPEIEPDFHVEAAVNGSQHQLPRQTLSTATRASSPSASISSSSSFQHPQATRPSNSAPIGDEVNSISTGSQAHPSVNARPDPSELVQRLSDNARLGADPGQNEPFAGLRNPNQQSGSLGNPSTPVFCTRGSTRLAALFAPFSTLPTRRE